MAIFKAKHAFDPRVDGPPNLSQACNPQDNPGIQPPSSIPSDAGSKATNDPRQASANVSLPKGVRYGGNV